MGARRNIITLNGAPNTGKTTVAEYLARTRPMTVSIELDSRCVGRITRHLHPPTKEYVLEKFGHTILEDCATLALNWIDRECDVIFPGPIWINGFVELKAHLDQRLGGRRVAYHCFNLKPPLEIALEDRGARPLTDEDRGQIRDGYGWLYEPSYGQTIDNSGQTIEETAALIEDYLHTGKALYQTDEAHAKL